MDNSGFLDPIWNKQHIERMEIVVKETLDVKGDRKERKVSPAMFLLPSE